MTLTGFGHDVSFLVGAFELSYFVFGCLLKRLHHFQQHKRHPHTLSRRELNFLEALRLPAIDARLMKAAVLSGALDKHPACFTALG